MNEKTSEIPEAKGDTGSRNLHPSDTFTRIIAIMSILISLGTLSFTGYRTWSDANRPTYSQLIEQGNSYFDTQNFRSAIRQYDEAIQMYESNPMPWKYKGIAYINLGLENDSEFIPRSSKPMYIYADRILDNYNPDDTLSHEQFDAFLMSYSSFSETLGRNPGDIDVRLFKALTCLFISPGYFCDAISEFNETLSLIHRDPHREESRPLREIERISWKGKRLMYVQLGLKEKAEECLKLYESINRTLQKTG